MGRFDLIGAFNTIAENTSGDLAKRAMVACQPNATNTTSLILNSGGAVIPRTTNTNINGVE